MKKVSVRVLVVILLSMGVQIVGQSSAMVAAVAPEAVCISR